MQGQQAKPHRLPRLPITLAVEVAEVGRCSLASTIAHCSPTSPVALVTLASLTVEVAEVGGWALSSTTTRHLPRRPQTTRCQRRDEPPAVAGSTNPPSTPAGRTPHRRWQQHEPPSSPAGRTPRRRRQQHEPPVIAGGTNPPPSPAAAQTPRHCRRDEPPSSLAAHTPRRRPHHIPR